MKKILLFLMVLVFSIQSFAVIDTLKLANMDNGASWSTGALPTATDTALMCAAYNVACSTTVTTKIECAAFIWRAGFTQATSMPGCTLATHYYCDSSTGGNKPKLAKLRFIVDDTAKYIVAATSGMNNQYTGSTIIEVDCKNMRFLDYKGTDYAKLIINNGKSIRTSLNNTHFAYTPNPPVIKMYGGGYCAWGSNTVMNNSGKFFEIESTDTLAGVYAFYNNGANAIDTLPAYNRYPVANVTVGFSAAANPSCKIYVDSVTQATPKQVFYNASNNSGHSGAHIYYNGPLNIGQFYYGGGATGGKINIHFGRGVPLTLGLQAISWDGGGNTSYDTLWFDSNTINNYRSWRYSPYNVINGNYIVREVGFTVDETILSAGKHFRDFRNVRATVTKRTNLADSMQCDSVFYDSAGKFGLNGFPLYTRDFYYVAAESLIVDAPLYWSRNAVFKAAANLVKWTNGRLVANGASAGTLTSNNNTFRNVTIDKSANGLTVTGKLPCTDTLRVTDGTLTLGDTAWCNVLIWTSTDSSTLPYPIIVSGSASIASGCKIGATAAGKIIFTAGTHYFTVGAGVRLPKIINKGKIIWQ
jgi:hypothetical protein